jgi:hypothetical protein
MDCSTAWMERGLLMSKWIIMPGNMTMPRNATAGSCLMISVSVMDFLPAGHKNTRL